MATIKEIAKKCGVSVATVSNILNGKPGASEATRELVLKTAEKMEYMPSYVAKSLKTRNTRNIGVIAEDMTIFSIPDIIDGITEYCEKVDYKIFLTNLRLFKKYNDRYYHRDDYYSMVKQEIKKFVAMQTEGRISDRKGTPEDWRDQRKARQYSCSGQTSGLSESIEG